MKIKFTLVTLCLILCFCFASAQENEILYPINLNKEYGLELSKNNTQFTIDLYKRLAKEKEGQNLIFSSYSLSSALAMTRIGAMENTAKQMDQALSFYQKSPVLHAAFEYLNNQLVGSAEHKGITLHIANSLWKQTGFDVSANFVKSLKDYYKAEVHETNFMQDPEASRVQVNQWFADKTQQIIKELFKKRTLQKTTRFILGNAIYFKGNWEYVFDKKQTKPFEFEITPEKYVSVPMMFLGNRHGGPLKTKFGFVEVEDVVDMVELPYAGKEFSMLVLVPAYRTTIQDLEKKLTAETLTVWIDKLRPTKLQFISIPKFKVGLGFEAQESLKKMGMVDAFTKKADFSGLEKQIKGQPKQRRIKLDKVIHKAFFEVTEEGSVAAAASAVQGIRKLSSMGPPAILADRPFIFAVMHKSTRSLIFIGRVVDPTK